MAHELPPPPMELMFGSVVLRFSELLPGETVSGIVPSYHFQVLRREDGAVIGHINFRVGDGEHVRICAGHIGYAIDEPFRGNGYACQACRAIEPFVATIYDHVIITCDPENTPSRRTIEKLGCTFIDEAVVPEHDPHYARGSRTKLRFRWQVRPPK